MKNITINFIRKRIFNLTVEGLNTVNSLVVKGTIVFKDKVTFVVNKCFTAINKTDIKSSAKFSAFKRLQPNHKVDIKNDIHFSSVKKTPPVQGKVVYISNVVESKQTRLPLPKQVFIISHLINIWSAVYTSNLKNKFIPTIKIYLSELQRLLCSSAKLVIKTSASTVVRKRLITSLNRTTFISNITAYKLSKIRANNTVDIKVKPLNMSLYRLSKLGDYDGLTLSQMDSKTLGELDGIEIT